SYRASPWQREATAGGFVWLNATHRVSIPSALGSHPPEALDAFLDRRVRRERVDVVLTDAGVGEEHVLDAFADLELGTAVRPQLLQRRGQSFGVAGDVGAGGVGQVLAPAIDCQAQERGENRRQHQQDDQQQRHDALTARAVAASVGAAAPARPAADAAEERPAADQVAQDQNGAQRRHQHRHETDVVVPDVRHLVGHDALEFLPVEHLQHPARDGYRTVLRVATRREGVGRGRVDDVDVGHGDARADGDGFGDVDEVTVLLRSRRAGARGGQGDLVREPEPYDALPRSYRHGCADEVHR